MKFKKIIIALLASLFIFTSCESTPDATSSASGKNSTTKQASKGPIFEGWKGEWHTIELGLSDSSLEDVYAKTASKMSNYTVDGLKVAVASMYATGTNIVKIKFDGSSRVVFTVLDDGKEKEIEADYIYTGKKEMPGYKDHYWETFEIAKNVRGLTNAKYMVFTDVHGGDEGLEHFHCRFNGRSIDSAIAGSNWPTFTRTSKTKAELVKYHSENIANYAKMFPSSPFEDFAKKGKWINRSAAYRNPSKEVDAAYQKLIKEFAGKNPKGGDFTKNEVIKILEDRFAVPSFTDIEFNVENGKNEMKIYKDGKLLFASSYKRVAANPSKPGMLAVKSDKTNAGKYTTISFTGIHGKPLHSHFWYGESDKDLNNFKAAPTIMPADSSNADIAVHVEGAGRIALNEFIK